MDQYRIPCVIMRAGTSKGIFLKENDLPAPGPERDAMILQIFGSPDKRQINGLAGADPLTSKLAVIGPSKQPGCDVDYTFAQVSITDAVVDWNGNCGNISSGVAPFAIDESIVKCHEGLNEVTIWQVNTQKVMKSYVLVEDRKAKVTGDVAIAGVPAPALSSRWICPAPPAPPPASSCRPATPWTSSRRAAAPSRPPSSTAPTPSSSCAPRASA